MENNTKEIKRVSAIELFEWMEQERTTLCNTTSFMLDPILYRKTMDVLIAFNIVIDYIKLSKIIHHE